MERRGFFKKIFTFLTLGGLLLLGTTGCEKYQHKKLEKFGNQDRLWHLIMAFDK